MVVDMTADMLHRPERFYEFYDKTTITLKLRKSSEYIF